jgi:hypothetical protein
MYKAADLVSVYYDHERTLRLDSFHQRPYSMAGYDNYKYKGVMYKGYRRVDTGEVYILLSQPLLKEPI